MTVTTLRIRIAVDGPPPYEQLRDRLRDRIERGRLLPGDRVPPVREMADQLGLAPNTVARAYRELVEDGWLEGRGRAGTFVTERPPISAAEGATALAEAARRYVRRADQLGFNREAAIRALRRA